MSENKKNIVIMDFSGIYDMENFYEKVPHLRVDLRELSGCNCYCDDEAKDNILEKIKNYPISGMHFIDSGNYHYMSRLWLEKINRPFRLLVFDNHTDMQLPAFGGILSCGGWIAATIEEVSFLEEVILVGPDEEAYAQAEPCMKAKTRFLSREVLKNPEMETSQNHVIETFFRNIPKDMPLYISVDKDVLCQEDASTTWSQGDMKLKELKKYLQIIFESFREHGQEIIGIDICGECDLDKSTDNEKNNRANADLLDLWRMNYEK